MKPNPRKVEEKSELVIKSALKNGLKKKMKVAEAYHRMRKKEMIK